MAIIQKLRSSWRRQKLYNSSAETFQTRNNFVSALISTSAKVSGNVINFGNGILFRKATNYTRWTSKVDVGSPNSFTGIRTDALRRGQAGYNYESEGGYVGDDILTQSTCANGVNGSAISSAILPPTMPTLMRNEAVTKAMLKLSSSKAAIGEDLATFRQTAGMIRNPCATLMKTLREVSSSRELRQFIRRNQRSFAREGDHTRAARRYLEYVYGWKPLMQDIYGVIELMKKTGANPLLINGRASSRQSSTLNDFQYSNVSQKEITSFTGGQERVQVSCSLWAQIDPQYAGLRALNQLGLLNPASLAWELVSWSFVVDWFCPIGSVLNALTARAGLTFVDGTLSTRVSANAGLEVWDNGLESIGNYGNIQRSKASSTWTYEGYTRSTLSNWPLPGFWVDTDPLGFERDSDRPLKALALAIMNLRSLR